MKGTLNNFIYKNLWLIGVAMFGLIVWGVKLDFQVQAVSEVYSTFPSADYFDLKFDTIDKNFERIDKQLTGE